MSGSGTAGGRIAPGVGANLIGQHAQDRNQDATVYVGNLDVQVAEELIWELFTQAGPIVNVYLPKDRVTNQHQGYGFVEFRGEEDAEYAIKILNMIKMYGKPIRVNKASQDKKTLDVGANLFIGNLDPDVDEKLLYDTFSAFGVIIATPKIMRDPDTGNSKGFGFISYDCFEASDAAIEAMNGQYLCNRAIAVSYAYKKDSQRGERHGTPAERLLAAQNRDRQAQQSRPHTLFASGPKQQPQPGPPTSVAMPLNAASGFAAGGAPPPPVVPTLVVPVLAAIPPPAAMPPAPPMGGMPMQPPPALAPAAAAMAPPPPAAPAAPTPWGQPLPPTGPPQVHPPQPQPGYAPPPGPAGGAPPPPWAAPPHFPPGGPPPPGGPGQGPSQMPPGQPHQMPPHMLPPGMPPRPGMPGGPPPPGMGPPPGMMPPPHYGQPPPGHGQGPNPWDGRPGMPPPGMPPPGMPPPGMAPPGMPPPGMPPPGMYPGQGPPPPGAFPPRPGMPPPMGPPGSYPPGMPPPPRPFGMPPR